MRVDPSRLAAARLWAAHRFPYLASGLFATRLISVPGIKTVAVDESWRMYVDPEVIESWTTAELGSMLVHHTGHLLRDHAGRAAALGIGKEQGEQWTMATDAEINDDLVDTGLDMPGQPVQPSDLGCEPSRLAEEYFRHLQHEREHDPDRDDSHGCPECGSGADSVPRDWDLPQDAAQAPGISGAEAHLLRCQVASELLRHGGLHPGKVPAGLLRWAQELIDPKVDWRKVLAAEVRRGIADVSGRVDYTYRRPSRRASVMGDVVLPSLRRPIPEVAVVCDTSGSMDEHLLGEALAEIDGLVRGLGMRNDRLRVLSCDTSVHAVRRASSGRQVELYGGGGTNMGAGIDAALELRPRPSVVVVLTDGYTPWPAQPPKGAKVIVGLLGTGTWHPPDWARAIRIEDVAVA